MGAHLRPLDKGETMDGFMQSRNQPWNISAACSNSASSKNGTDDLQSSSSLICSVLTSELPTNHAAFNLAWKRCNTDQLMKYHFLMRYPSENVSLSQVFKTDLPSNIFTESCSVLNYCFEEADQVKIIRILDEFSTSKRFKLTMNFLSKEEKELIQLLFEKFDCDKVSSSLLSKYQIEL